MKTWQADLVEADSLTSHLNALSADGWEVFSVHFEPDYVHKYRVISFKTS